MKIKLSKPPKGAKISAIPTARAAVSWGISDDGVGQIALTISAEDSFGIPYVVTSLRLSLAEANDLARQVGFQADRLQLEINAHAERANLPPCAASMGCLCAGHARGDDASAPCDTTE